MSIQSVIPSNHLILCRPLPLPSIFPSIRVFSNESVLCIWWPKYWSFNFSISPYNEYSELISFRMDWFDLPAVQGALKSLLQHHSSKASILLPSAFLIVQLSHPYMTTGKTIALTRWTTLPLFSRHSWRVCTPCLWSVMYRQPNVMLRIWTPVSSVWFHRFLAWSLIFSAVGKNNNIDLMGLWKLTKHLLYSTGNST